MIWLPKNGTKLADWIRSNYFFSKIYMQNAISMNLKWSLALWIFTNIPNRIIRKWVFPSPDVEIQVFMMMPLPKLRLFLKEVKSKWHIKHPLPFSNHIITNRPNNTDEIVTQVSASVARRKSPLILIAHIAGAVSPFGLNMKTMILPRIIAIDVAITGQVQWTNLCAHLAFLAREYRLVYPRLSILHWFLSPKSTLPKMKEFWIVLWQLFHLFRHGGSG